MCRGVEQKPLIPYRLCPLSSDGYLVEQKLEKMWMALAAEYALNSPQSRWDIIWESSNTRGVNCKSLLNSRRLQTISLYIYINLHLFTVKVYWCMSLFPTSSSVHQMSIYYLSQHTSRWVPRLQISSTSILQQGNNTLSGGIVSGVQCAMWIINSQQQYTGSMGKSLMPSG